MQRSTFCTLYMSLSLDGSFIVAVISICLYYTICSANASRKVFHKKSSKFFFSCFFHCDGICFHAVVLSSYIALYSVPLALTSTCMYMYIPQYTTSDRKLGVTGEAYSSHSTRSLLKTLHGMCYLS